VGVRSLGLKGCLSFSCSVVFEATTSASAMARKAKSRDVHMNVIVRSGGGCVIT